MSQPPQQPPPPGQYGPPPTVIVNQNKRGCGTIFLVILGILFLIGVITVILFIVGMQVT